MHVVCDVDSMASGYHDIQILSCFLGSIYRVCTSQSTLFNCTLCGWDSDTELWSYELRDL